MKKMFVLLLSVLMVGSLIVTASADILWAPTEDKAFNHEKAILIDATYYVPDDMTVNLYSSPVGGKLLQTMEAGQKVYVGYSQEFSTEVWGVGYAKDENHQEGWFRLGRLQKEYDHKDFMAEHEAELTNDAPVFTKDDISSTVYTWTYPGSGVQSSSIPAEALRGNYNDGKLEFHYVYTDPTGGRWGYVGYFMGRCGWVWLDDPTNSEPTYRAEPNVTSTVTDTSETEKAPSRFRDLLPVLILAAIVVTGTDIMTKRMANKKSRR